MMTLREIELPEEGSFFLFGPRQTGKSTLIHSLYSEKTWTVDLLKGDLFLEYSKNPSLFRLQALEQLNSGVETILVDEIQRVPQLLQEIHHLMENSRGRFILTGSSARKLKRGGANLLAGRAVERRLFPFTYREIEDQFKLEDILRYGSLPGAFGKPAKKTEDILNAYVRTYLKEEIQAEGLSRNIGNFSRFLDVAASQFGELVNYSAIARECGVAIKSVQGYYEILEDTMIGFRLEPWRKSLRKRLTAHPKFYFFDMGVTNALNRQLTAGLTNPLRGRLFEQFILLETHRHLHYSRSEAGMFYWRTNHGAEVDLILEKHGDIKGVFEIKSMKRITSPDLSGLKSFKEEHPSASCFAVADVSSPYTLEGVRVLPWREFLSQLDQWM